MTNPDSPHGMDPKNRAHTPDDDNALKIGYEDDLNPEELALRRLLHDAVQDIEPRSETLNHLRRAVPARRAHRRQLLVGAAAACLLAIAAVPAALHAANSADSDNPNPANASSSHDSGTNGKTGGDAASVRPNDSASGGKKGSGAGSSASSGRPGKAATSTTDPSQTLAANAPSCTAADLGNSLGTTGTADAGGQVSGYFQVANISSGACTVDGGGSVSFTAQGSAQSSGISVVDHASGDGTSLPDSSGEPLILKAGESFQVRFTWVPASGGGTTGCETAATPTPTPTPSDGTSSSSSSGTTTGAGGTTTSLDSASDDTSASILLTYTPEAGGPAPVTTISNACAGTVYKTGAIASTT
ncbi:MAG: hypothetical protein QOF84_1963 [Streptomyces sp.]|nr:hypothetical protein [Streptomyces sp.]